MLRLRLLPLCVLTGAFLSCSGAMAQEVASPGRIVDRVDESQLVSLKGSVHPLAQARFDRGRVTPDLAMGDLILVLRRSPERQTAFDAFVASQYESRSPNYHHWLEPDQVGEQFGPAPSDLDTVQNWLRNHGFTIDEVSRDRMSIRFSGNAAQVESTFHTEIHNLDVKGEKHIANMADPQIPAALGTVVVGVKALHNFFPRPLHKLGPTVRRDPETGKFFRVDPSPLAQHVSVPDSMASRPQAPASGTGVSPDFGVKDSQNNQYELIVPYDLATIYNIAPLWTASTPIDGTGQKIAIAGTSNIVLSDVATFRQATGLPAKAPSVIITNTDPGTTSAALVSDRLENTLDVEWSGAVAKGASIILVASSATTTTTDPLYASESYIVNNKVAPVMNVSYGECELGLGTPGNTQYNNLWQTAASEGIAVFVSTGDSGAASCDQGIDTSQTYYAAAYGLQVSGLSSTPYNVAVGGTDFNWTSANWKSSNATNLSNANGYIPEVPWNGTIADPIIVAILNQQNSVNYDAETWANTIAYDYFTTGQITLNTYLSFISPTGGTGGVSRCTQSDGNTVASCKGGYAKPSWQTGVTGIVSSDLRTVPDVSFFASSGVLGSAYLICDTLFPNGSGGTVAASCDYSVANNALNESVGGTSVASPVMAGVMALINQKAGASQGEPNAELYKLAAAQSYSSCSAESVTASSSCYFNDIDKGNIAVPCDGADSTPNCPILYSGDALGILSGYSSTVGYDKATGLGSLNVANVVKAWPTATAAAVTLSPASLTFAATAVGSSSAAQAITLKNTGTAALSLNGTGQGITLGGTGASSFTETNNCGTSVAAGASCTITVTFKPATATALSAIVSIADNATGSPQSVALSGTGTSATATASLSAKALTFAATAVGVSSVGQSLTLSNTGTVALTLNGTGQGIKIAGTNATSFSQVNNCGTGLAAGAKCTIVVTFKPTAIGTLTGLVTVTDNATGSPQSVTLTGTGSGAVVSLSRTSVAFAGTPVGAVAATQSFTVTNKGNAALALNGSGEGITVKGTNPTSFSQTNTCGTSLAANGVCTVTVSFKPQAAGALSATISIADNAAGSPQLVTLTGTGTAPAVSLSVKTVTFPATVVGQSAVNQSFIVTNSGTAPLTLNGTGQGIKITGANATSFGEITNCGTGLAAGAKCTIVVSFKPTAIGTLTGAVTITDNAAGSPQSVAITGTGSGAVASLSRTSLAFAGTPVGTAAATQTFTLTNKGNAAMALNGTGHGITVGGTNATSFSQTNTCGTSLAANAVCTFTVSFRPQAAGALSASISIADNAPGSPQTVALTGTGTAPAISLSVSSLTFAGTTVGQSAVKQSLLVTNSGNAPLTLNGTGQGIKITGTNATSFTEITNCGATLAAGSKCTIVVTFTPTATGTLTGLLNVTGNSNPATKSATLTGTGK